MNGNARKTAADRHVRKIDGVSGFRIPNFRTPLRLGVVSTKNVNEAIPHGYGEAVAGMIEGPCNSPDVFGGIVFFDNRCVERLVARPFSFHSSYRVQLALESHQR